VKVSHHGSSDQSDLLYERLAAPVGIIGVGANNDYGHPTERLLAILDGVHTAAARTDRDGLVLVAPADGAEAITLFRQRSGVVAGG
jgi:competence protein ComEC